MLEGCVDWPEEFRERYRAAGYWRDETLGGLLRGWARRHGGRTALVAGATRWGYAELDRRADRLAAGLVALGVAAGDRVVVHLPNRAEFAVVCFALFRVGALPVLALPAHRDAEIAHLCRLSDAVAYVVPDELDGVDFRALARRVRSEAPSVRHVLVAGEAAEFVPLAEVDGEPVALPEPSPAEVALLLLSGGTTGAPKLIPRTHRDYGYSLRASAEVCGLGPGSVYLAALPAAHAFPLAAPGVLGTWSAGGTVVFATDPSPDGAFPLIEAERVTITSLVPPLAAVWAEAAEWSDADLSSLRLLQVGGARLPAASARRVPEALGCRLQQVFGMAEGLVNFTRLDDPPDVVATTQGRPMCPDDEVRVVDESDAPLPDGATGELQVRGPCILRGYYRDPVANARSFTADGFFRTGDLVRRLPSGHLVVEGRRTDVVNRGGEKVPVEEVEHHLLAHPAVRDVVVVGVPDAGLGERTCACVIPRAAAPTLAELRTFLQDRGLAAFKFPDRLEVLDSFPRTGVGKVSRRALAARFTEPSAATG
ncbi:(2,3-dihydroxybenzoyl)adenylate synthase [Saccharothrix australiensis]|uniref:2,3-dihydroxybenzoate-AMP ligase n=1 Tax=Saccharothrix australiensis TaxID=2072 RepID=A0A495W374_9PSEU|nr:AMP-binding protein [Saccharothrix australiensis]RKT54268.1 2,3-dihydroxybenzoate-AMP ligase [Saccharothrix australiensis]